MSNGSITERLNTALAGRYRIERHLGAGGMATVYLAEDLKHDRKVALKVLKPELAAVLGAERFVVEIKTTASLQHPHILPLFDSGTADGFLYYVMPFIEGETLRDKLNRETQLGVDEAVRITREVADALDYAHRRGVIHRDIKPENILLHDGRPMVADFGIALAVSAAAGGRMTETGLSLGTPHYMSPEQATADKEISARSDVYSLASVLYEALSGEPPHTGGSAQQVIMKIIAEPAQPVTDLRKSVPPNVAAALSRALEKLPADRFESAKTFSEALGNPTFAMTGSAALQAGTRTNARARQREFLAWSLVVALAVLAGWASFRPRTEPPLGRAMRFDLTLPPALALSAAPGRSILISADGSTLLYRTPGPRGTQLAKRRLDETTPTLIPGTDGAGSAELSPDGAWVAFFVENTLKKVSLAGGSPTTLATLPPGAMSWGRNDTIVIAGALGNMRRALQRVPASGGVVREFLPYDTTRGGRDMFPRIVDDAGVVLFQRGGERRIAIASLKTATSTLLNLTGIPLGIIDGHLVFARADGTIAAVPLDVAHHRVTGEPVTVVDNAALGKASLADNGTLVYETGSGGLTLVLVDQKGAVRTLPATPQVYTNPRFAPDGKRVAVSVGGVPPHQDIWVYDFSVTNAPATAIRLASEEGVNLLKPEWSPDGRRIFFALTRPDSGDINSIWSQVADGSAPREPVASLPNESIAEVVISRDGGMMVVRTGSNSIGTNLDLWYRNLVGDTALKPLLTSRSHNELKPALSPDGKWLAYVSNESGQNEVYVRAFPGPQSKWPVSAGGGDEPMWARDGHQLFYRARGKMMAASVAPNAGTFSVTARNVLFDDRFVRSTTRANYDVSPDGGGFLMVQRGDSASALMITVNLGAVLRKGTK